jgi:hypothetical protein
LLEGRRWIGVQGLAAELRDEVLEFRLRSCYPGVTIETCEVMLLDLEFQAE